MLPLVSIIIPCYNAGRYIAASIQTALDQTYPNCEIIVIDDGSSDDSLKIIKSFGNRIRWETGPNQGGCAARNRGLALSEGEWIQFLDADDILLNTKIEHQMATLDLSDQTVSATCRLIVSADPECEINVVEPVVNQEFQGKSFAVDKCSGFLNFQGLNVRSPSIVFGHTTSWLISKHTACVVGGWDKKLSICQDSDFFLRVAISSSKVIVVGEVLGYYRTGVTGSVSSSFSLGKAISYLTYCEKATNILIPVKHIRSKLAVATIYTEFVIRCYPEYKDLIQKAFLALKDNGVPEWQAVRAPRLRLLTRIVGLKSALFIRRCLESL